MSEDLGKAGERAARVREGIVVPAEGTATAKASDGSVLGVLQQKKKTSVAEGVSKEEKSRKGGQRDMSRGCLTREFLGHWFHSEEIGNHGSF